MNRAASRLWDGTAFAPGTSLPLTDRAIRYGLALFETIRVRRTRAERVAPHLASLRHACANAGFPDPAHALPEAWSRLVPDGIPGCLADLPAADTGTLRLYLTGGDGPPNPVVDQPRLFLLFEPRAHPGPDRPAFALAPPTPTPLAFPAGLKSANYWPHLAALDQARRAGFDEAILANAYGSVRSAAMGNLFVRVTGRWLTPPAHQGARAGTVRAWVLDQRFAAESPVGLPELDRADAAFVTNSWLGIQPVGRIGERRLDEPGTVHELAAAFDSLTD